MTDTPSSQAILAALMKPTMPETYDRSQAFDEQSRQGREIFGSIVSGITNPFGLTRALEGKIEPHLSPEHQIIARWLVDRAAELGDPNPGLRDTTSAAALAPFLGRALVGNWKEGLAPSLGLAGPVGGLVSILRGPTFTHERPQAAYPPGGAY